MMAGVVVRRGTEEAPERFFRSRFLGFLTLLLLLLLAHSASAGAIGRERPSDADTQEDRTNHTLDGDGYRYHYQDQHDHGDTHRHDNASLDTIMPVPEAYGDTDNPIRIWAFLLLFFMCLVCCVRLWLYQCLRRKKVIREVIILQRIQVREKSPAVDSGAAAPLSGGTDTGDAPPAYSALDPQASRAPR